MSDMLESGSFEIVLIDEVSRKGAKTRRKLLVKLFSASLPLCGKLSSYLAVPWDDEGAESTHNLNSSNGFN